MAQPRIPATVITGFLGSGKTTLIRNIITQANGKRLALIVLSLIHISEPTRLR